MPRTTMLLAATETRPSLVQADSGGCFGYMASNTYFKGERERVSHLFYMLENQEQQAACSSLFDNNPIFPHHQYMTQAEYGQVIADAGCSMDSFQSADYHGLRGVICVTMRPEEYPEGIPEDMFISGLFTARNTGGMHHGASRFLGAELNVHPMLMYVLSQIILSGGIDSSDTRAHNYLRSSQQRASSSNVDGLTFGSANFLNIYRAIKGEEHVALFQGTQTIFERGGYKRDHQFQNGTDDDRVSMYGYQLARNMNSSLSPIDNDVRLIEPDQFSPMYLATVLEALCGEPVIDVTQIKLSNGVKFGEYYSAQQAEDEPLLPRFLSDKRPRYKKSYKVGDVVTPRADAKGVKKITNSSVASSAQMLGYTHQYGKSLRTSAYGIVPNVTTVEAIDKTRVESIKLTNGCWVHPRYIKLYSVSPAENIIGIDTDAPVQGDLVVHPVRGDMLVRTNDPFERLIRCVSLSDTSRNSFGEEFSVQPNGLTKKF